MVPHVGDRIMASSQALGFSVYRDVHGNAVNSWLSLVLKHPEFSCSRQTHYFRKKVEIDVRGLFGK
jgi:hypothetical protein